MQIRHLIHLFEAGWILFRSDLKAQYRGSFLGLLWIPIPLLLTGATFIFLRRHGFFTYENQTVSYPAFAMTGITLWQIFCSGLNSPIQHLSSQKGILLNPRLKMQVVQIQSFFHAAFETAVKFLVLAAVLMFLGALRPGYFISGFGCSVTVLLFGFSVGVLISTFAATFIDVKRLVQTGLVVLFFATPIFYTVPPNNLAEHVIRLNPLAHLISGSRSMILGSGSSFFQTAAIFSGLSFLLIYAGIKVSINMRSFMVERV